MDLDATSTCFFGVSDSKIQTSLLRLTAMETSWKIKISFEASSDMMLSNRNNKGPNRPAWVSAYAVQVLKTSFLTSR